MATSRQNVCETIAALLPSYATGLQATYSYLRYTFGTNTPVALVVAAGSRRERLTPQGGTLYHLIDIHLFALYASDADSVTEQDAYSTLAALEQGVSDMVDRNRRGTDWKDLRYRGETTIQDDIVEGLPYLHEIVPLEALV